MRKEYDFSKGKRGPAIDSPGKTQITIMLDNDIIEAFRERAEARETLINSRGQAQGDTPTGVAPCRLSAKKKLKRTRAGFWAGKAGLALQPRRLA